MIAKGRIKDDYTYDYRCANCDGLGIHANNEVCHHCYNLDLPQLMAAFATARGERYYALLKAILSVIGRDICQDAIARKRDGTLRIIDLCYLMDKYQFPENRMKALAEWLEECRIVTVGAYDQMQERGFKVKQAMEQYRKVTNDT